MKSANEKVFDLLESTGTNWTVNKKALITSEGLTTESFGLFRNDTNNWLGTVGNQYVIMQNATMAQTIVEAANNLNLDCFRGGHLSEGAKVYYQVCLDDIQVGTDTLKRYITALNSHDGSTSVAFGSSSTVVICRNTFYKAYKGLDKFRHTESAEIRVKMAMASLVDAMNKDNKLMENFQPMTEQPINTPIFENLIKKLFNTDLNVTPKEVSTRKQNQLKEFNKAVELEVSRHGGATLWSLFNAVTYYTNHVETLDKDGQVKKDAVQNIMVGTGLNKNLVAYDLIMDWIEANTAVAVPVGM